MIDEGVEKIDEAFNDFSFEGFGAFVAFGDEEVEEVFFFCGEEICEVLARRAF